MYVVTYNTESGDRGVIGLFAEKPSDGHLSAITVRDFPDEIEPDEGDGPRRLIFFDVEEVTVMELPEPITPIESI